MNMLVMQNLCAYQDAAHIIRYFCEISYEKNKFEMEFVHFM